MPWLKLDDSMGDHRKITRTLKTSRAAIALHFLGLLHCSRYLTDGFIEHEFVEDLCDMARIRNTERTRAVAALVENGLWFESEGGWIAHDYLDHNPSREQVEANRGVDRLRKELTRDHSLIERIRSRDGDTCRYCGVTVNWKDRKSAAGGTYDHVQPISKGGGNEFANVVVACRGCNQKKGPRTPEQAGMVLAGSSPRLDRSGPNLAQESGSRPVPSRPTTTPPTPPRGKPGDLRIVEDDIA